MNKDSNLELAHIYTKAAFTRCSRIKTVTYQGKVCNYRVARVGVGDGLWVDTEGILHLQRNGKFAPQYLIALLFEKLSTSDFDKVTSILDFENPGKLKQIQAHQFGERSMVVGQDGTLYFVANNEKIGLVGQPGGSSIGLNARLNSGLEHIAYEAAKTGYDASCLGIARAYLETSGLSDIARKQSNAMLYALAQAASM